MGLTANARTEGRFIEAAKDRCTLAPFGPPDAARNVGMKKALAIVAWIAIAALPGCRRDVDQPAPAVAPPMATQDKVQALEQKAATGNSATPSDAEIIRRPEAQAVDPSGAEPMDNGLTCLARTIYWEARGESTAEMEAVANVVMNRLGHDGFPDTVCEVVKQGHEQGACQFSWWCDGRSDQAREDESYAIAKEIARRALNLQLADRTDGALYFHQRKTVPGWAAKYIKTAEIENFVFYKPGPG
jgi:spore germination cell wall hydrolase CwlJ-like protein